MTKKELFKKINEKCIELDNKYDINSGGCCYIAAVLAELLSKNNISYKVIIYDKFSLHYAIKVEDRYLNRGDYLKKEISETIKNYHYKELYNLYYSKDEEWNPCYNRKLNGTIKNSLIKIFNKYEKRRSC